MKLHEYQAKKIFFNYKLPIPSGYVCKNLNELELAASKINSHIWALKCQIHAGGRGKVGGVKIINDKKDIKTFAKKWFGNMMITGQTSNTGKIVKKILIEDANIHISNELYLGIMTDTVNNNVIAIASKQGGTSIEKIAKEHTNLIHKVILDPYIGLQLYQARSLAYKLKLSTIQVNNFIDIFMKLASLFFDLDLSLVEINPLVVTNTNNLICLDSKIIVDKNAKFRQKKFFEIYDYSQDDPKESYATQHGFNYISLKGNIGCLVNGAGLAMATMDIIQLYGGKPANFLDIGGNLKKESIIEAFNLILQDHKVLAILVNIFGGIVRCDLIAESIITIAKEKKINIPIVVRLEGNNSNIGLKKLSENNVNIISAHNLDSAAKLVVEASQGKNNHVYFNQ